MRSNSWRYDFYSSQVLVSWEFIRLWRDLFCRVLYIKVSVCFFSPVVICVCLLSIHKELKLNTAICQLKCFTDLLLEHWRQFIMIWFCKFTFVLILMVEAWMFLISPEWTLTKGLHLTVTDLNWPYLHRIWVWSALDKVVLFVRLWGFLSPNILDMLLDKMLNCCWHYSSQSFSRIY